MSGQTKKFKTEVQHLLDLMIHSLYSNKDIFIRELVANAADAIDKARFEALTNKDISREWAINLEIDQTNKLIKIRDNGIGMTEDEVIINIGTIAKSGTREFIEAIEESKPKAADIPQLIGQFGVGFYSSFMVAEKVELVTKKAGSVAPAVRWTSDGKSSYTIEEASKEDQGTEITVYLKEDAKAYLESWKISEIVKKYSDFIEYPIILPVTKTNEDKTETTEERTLNSRKAIWLRTPEEITEEDHKTFYSHLSHFSGSPLKAIQFSAEGTSEFKALLYIPEKSPFNIFMPEVQKKGLQLYVRRVFITDECKDLIPDYLRFIKGVVDSNDLPLNVSREILQENPLLLKIQKNIVRKVLGELQKMQDNEPEKYTAFFKEFGKVLKEGIHTDVSNQEKIKELAMYETMNNEAGKLISLKQYVAQMPASQKDIYYITGENRPVFENSPALEYFRSKGFDVLFMTDPIDEWVMQSMFQYDKKHFRSAAKGEIDLDEDSKKKSEEVIKNAASKHKTVIEFLEKELAENIQQVRFSQRLTESACCLVGDENSMSPHMERIFKALNQQMPKTKRILELNPEHPLINALQKMYDQDKNNIKLKDYAGLIYDQALLTEGSPIPDPMSFAKRVTALMVASIEKS
ncbi:MAG: molecular chaperone HtpG [Victivallaceae bacterium]